MASRVLVMVVLMSAATTSGAAQERSGAGDLKIALFDLRVAVSSRAHDLGPASKRLEAATRWLINNYERGKPGDVSPEYARQIEAAADLLKRSPSPAVVEDIATELEAKVEHCRRMGLGMGGTVLLKIETRRGGSPVQNLQVFYLLKIFERIKGAAPGNFPRLSSPTERPLEPGRYWFWARDPATGQESQRTLVTVAGQKEIVVDLPVP